MPYDTTVSLWLRAIPEYTWQPVQVLAAPGDATAYAIDPFEGSPNGQASGLPTLRLVLTGLRWTAYPVWSQRESVGWEQMQDLQRLGDEQRNEDRRQSSGKVRPPPNSQGPTDAAGAARSHVARDQQSADGLAARATGGNPSWEAPQ
ncbi:MAG: hypothetical protein ABI696_00225 [Rubrivivax sp.]